ncbi:MAG: hypothetical protein HUU08_18110 [Candidatus Brocadia sp.]|nr:hypothetical protein [Candidatus Brocadia sp.]
MIKVSLVLLLILKENLSDVRYKLIKVIVSKDETGHYKDRVVRTNWFVRADGITPDLLCSVSFLDYYNHLSPDDI